MNNLKSRAILPHLILKTNNPIFSKWNYLVSYIKCANFLVYLFLRVRKSNFACTYFCESHVVGHFASINFHEQGKQKKFCEYKWTRPKIS